MNDRHSDYISKLLPTVKRNSVIKYDNSTKLLDYDTTINYSIQQTYTLNSHFSIDTSIYIDDDGFTGIIYQVQTATKQIVLYRNIANFGGLSKFGTHNLGDIEIHSSSPGPVANANAVGYWAFNENDNTIVVGALVRVAPNTHLVMNRLDLQGNTIDNGKYSPLGYGSMTWTPSMTSEQDLLNIYSTATTTGGTNPDGGAYYMFTKGANFDNIIQPQNSLSIRISGIPEVGIVPILGAGGISSAITSGNPSDNEVLLTVHNNANIYNTHMLFNGLQGDEDVTQFGGDNSVNSGNVGTNGGEAWFQMEFSAPKYVTSYKMWPRAGGPPPAGGTADNQATYMPKNFAIYGSNDGVSFTLLDQQTNQTHPGTNIGTVLGSGINAGGSGNSSRTWSVSEAESLGYSSWGSPNYIISNPGSYKIYKFSVTATAWDNSVIGMSEFALYGRDDSRTNIYEYNVENLNNKWLHLVNTFSPDHIPRLWINNTEIMANVTLTQNNDTTINDDEGDLVALKFGLCDAKDCAFSYDATGFIFDQVSGSAIDLGNGFDVTSANILGNNSRTIIANIKIDGVGSNSQYIVCAYGDVSGSITNSKFEIRLRNGTTYGGDGAADGNWAVGLAVNGASGDDNYGIGNSNPMAFYSGSDLTVQEGVQTTIACSYDGPSKTGYIFIKNPTTGLWGMKSHTFSSEINTALGRGFTIGALPTGVSDLTWGLFKGEIGEVIIYNHSVTNANFYGENAKLLDAPSKCQYIEWIFCE